jgi:hypothetical protein
MLAAIAGPNFAVQHRMNDDERSGHRVKEPAAHSKPPVRRLEAIMPSA